MMSWVHDSLRVKSLRESVTEWVAPRFFSVLFVMTNKVSMFSIDAKHVVLSERENQFFASLHHTKKHVFCDGVGSLQYRKKPVFCDGVFSLRHTSFTNVIVDSPSHVIVARNPHSVTRSPIVELYYMGWGGGDG